MDSDVFSRVLDVSRHMAEIRTLDPLLEYAVEQAMQLAGAERGYIVLVREQGTLEFRITRDADGQPLPDAQDQISTSILKGVIDEGEPLVIQDALANPNFNEARSVINLKLRSVMCVPLIARGVIRGAIYVENRSVRGMFMDDDLPPLTIFANQAAVAIENAILNEQLEARVAARTAELKQALEQLEDNWAEAEQAYRMRSLALGSVAHDIRAPLVVATTATSMLEDGSFGPLNGDQQHWLRKSHEAINHAIEMMQDVFDLARIEMGQFSYDPEVIELTTFLESIYESAQALPWEDGVKLHFDAPSDPLLLQLDTMHMRRVIFNLLSNALKFTHEGNVTLYTQPLDNEQVLIGVVDTGEGIASEQLDRLFDRFHQGDDPNIARRKKGTGLGLAISRELVELHGGEIWVESKVGEGSDFKFTLPTRIHPSDDIDLPDDRH